jgi:hypothetical protein
MIGFIVSYTFTHSRLQARQRYLYSTHFIGHRYTRTRILSLILATDLSQSHYNFKSHMKSSLHCIIHFLPLFNSSASKLISRQAGVWKLDYSLLCCSIEFFFVITLHGPHGKNRLLLFRIVLGEFITPLHRGGRGAGHIENSVCIVEACSLRSLLYPVVV